MEEMIEVPKTGNKEKSPNLLSVMLISAFSVIFLILIIWLLFVSKPEKITLGEDFELKEGRRADFIYGGETYQLKADRIGTDSVEINIDDVPLELRLEEIGRVDLDGNGEDDVELKLVGNEDKVPMFRLEAI